MFLTEHRVRVRSISGSYMRVPIFRSRSGLGFVVVFTVFPSECLDTPKIGYDVIPPHRLQFIIYQ